MHQTSCRGGGGALDRLSAFEAGPGTDEGDEGGVHGPPPLLRGLDELEDHGQGDSAGAGPAGDLGALLIRLPSAGTESLVVWNPGMGVSGES